METILFLLILLTTLFIGARALGLSASGKGKSGTKLQDFPNLPAEPHLPRLIRKRPTPAIRKKKEEVEECLEW